MNSNPIYTALDSLRTSLLARSGRRPSVLRMEPVYRIHRRVLNDLGGPRTPADDSPVEPAERERMRNRLWGPLAADRISRGLIVPRWNEFSLARRLKHLETVRRYSRALIATFWAGCPGEERAALEDDVMKIYQDPAEVLQGMPFSLGFLVHQTVHLITTEEEFTSRLVHRLISTSSLEAFGRRKIPPAWADPVAREAFPAWVESFASKEPEKGLIKYLRGERILRWLGARVFELRREGYPLAGRFGDLYLFFRCRLAPSRAHLEWIDRAAGALAALRRPEEAQRAWDALPARIDDLKAGAVELTREGGFFTEHFFGGAAR